MQQYAVMYAFICIRMVRNFINIHNDRLAGNGGLQ